MFLTWKNDLKVYCSIHDFKPNMCLAYPNNKGTVCLNHPERYFSLAFFHHQKKRTHNIIQVLKEFFHHSELPEICFDIIAYLMDFGRFPIYETQEFFAKEFDLSAEVFNEYISILANLTLIQKDYDSNGTMVEITGISSNEVESIVDRTIKEHGWDKNPNQLK